LRVNGRIIRYAQDCFPIYGTQVKAFEITELSATNYYEREADNSPVLNASGTGWNESGMHHIDPHPLPDGGWIACVDGFFWQELDLRAESVEPQITLLRSQDHESHYAHAMEVIDWFKVSKYNT
jgi:hypothetical protein